MFRRKQASQQDLDAVTQGDEVVVVVDQTVNPFLVLFHEPAGFRAEQIRGLRNRLMAMNPDGEPKTLVVTSAVREEGKTITALNLAMAFGELERQRVVLVDGDLRRPSCERYLNLTSGPGLSDVLLGREPLDRALRPAGYRNLMMLGAGTRVGNPAEVLSASRLDELFERLKERFQYVIIDSPPALSSTDAAVLSARADGTLMVVRLERSLKKQTKDAMRAIGDMGGNVLGTFVTEVRGNDPEQDARLGYDPREVEEL
ncbi:MAG: hypothetical protein RL398_1473 [Planctomycetota bacterium]